AASSSSFSGPSDLSFHLSSSSSSSSNNNNSTTIINENESSPSSGCSSDPDTSEPEPGVSGPISGACLSISFSCSSLIEPPSTLAEDEQPEHTAAPEREPAAECPPTCLCSNAPIGPHSFEIVKFLGRGSCGEVYLVRRTSCRTKQELFFAMKVLTKKQILQQNKVGRVLMEQEILMLANSPYVVKLFYSFQTEDFLHFVIELCIGGTLFRLVKGQPNSRISEEFVRFYAAEVCLALEHLHSVGYVHRDIKPENLLICENGHLKLADFDLSANIAETTHHPSASRRPRLSSFVGTPDYLSPEVVHGGSQSYVLDFWSLGVLIFEMLFGSSPFITSPTSRSSSISFRFVIPPEPRISSQCRSLIQALLQPADKRIGRRAGVSEIKNHPWFDGVDWSTVDQIQAPFDPRSYLTSPTDTRYFRNTHQRQLSRSYYESPMLTEILPASDPFYPFLLLSSPILASELPSDPSFVTPDALSQRTGTLHCGPMHKQGYFRKNWKKRWFVLSAERGGRCLKYYNSQSSMKLVDQIDVATVTEVAPGDVQRFSVSANNLPPDAKMEFLFHLISPSRVYHFICPSLQEREEWINILINLISIPLPS
ncbi:MAG: protein kinase, partial [archaeon]|nr:protein kinase [archaeon]